MKRHLLGAFYLICFHSYMSLAQVSDKPSLFISGNVGGFLSGVRDFDKIYDSKLAFAFGGSLGIPLSPEVYLFTKVIYFSKSDVPVVYSYYLGGSIPLTPPEPVAGNMSISQWVLNCGIQENVLRSKDIEVGVQGGLTYSKFTAGPENVVPGGAVPVSPVESHEMVGLFAGIVFEHRFGRLPLSAFAEVQADYMWPITSSHVANYGGLNLSGGIRVYFKGQ